MFGFGLYGATCFFQQMYDKLKAGETVKVFYDQFRSPLSVIEAARIIGLICESDISGEIINFGGSVRLSRYELAEMLCKTAGFDETLLDKISMYDIPNLPHVADVSMNIEKLQSYGITLKSTEEAIREIIQNQMASKGLSNE